HLRRHFAAVVRYQRLRHAQQRLRFRAVEAGRMKLRLELRGRGARERARVGVAREERRRHQIHARVGRLRGQDRRDEQLERRRIVQLGVRVRMLRLERIQNPSRVARALQCVVPDPLFQPTLLYESEKTRQCSWSAAIRFGTNCTGTTISARTGARTTCSCSASLISLSESGITSQNVSVKSNGVCAIEQKFEYVRGAVLLSSGTIVKLICLGWSGMPKSNPPPGGSVLSHHPDDDALDLDLVGLNEERLHRGIGRLQTNHPTWVAIELLARNVRRAQQRDHHFTGFGRLAIFDDHKVAVANLL